MGKSQNQNFLAYNVSVIGPVTITGTKLIKPGVRDHLSSAVVLDIPLVIPFAQVFLVDINSSDPVMIEPVDDM